MICEKWIVGHCENIFRFYFPEVPDSRTSSPNGFSVVDPPRSSSDEELFTGCWSRSGGGMEKEWTVTARQYAVMVKSKGFRVIWNYKFCLK